MITGCDIYNRSHQLGTIYIRVYKKHVEIADYAMYFLHAFIMLVFLFT